MRISDWSSDVCSSDLAFGDGFDNPARLPRRPRSRPDPLHPAEVRRYDGAVAADPRTAASRSARATGPGFFGGRACETRPELGDGPAMVPAKVRTSVPKDRHDPVAQPARKHARRRRSDQRSEEHTSELQSQMRNSYAV